ncbi:GPW/gp25 family protein, partial [Escherichia coli]|uniref:GPW/gp25 family protein n=1 Tax=Escherichia coli TaxID=562 RepID=UPI0028DFFA24
MAHLRQSIQDILTTPLGRRVMRRDYGTRLYELVDAPTNSETVMDLCAAAAEAVANWEPRFRLTQVKIASAEP